MPSAAFRFALEAAFLILVALGAALAKLEPVVIVGLMAMVCVLVALVERASAKVAAREAAVDAEPAPDVREAARHVEVVDGAEPQPEPAAESEPESESAVDEPELAVSERSARAILASGP